MKLSDFDYHLPEGLIAQKAASPRDQSRLLVLDRISGKIEHKKFFEIINYFKSGDLLVLNNTKVINARLLGKKAETGGKIEVFLLKKNPPNPPLSKGAQEVWQCLIGGKGRKENLKIKFAGRFTAEIIKNNEDGTWLVRFNQSGEKFMRTVEKIGQTPLPPYIKRTANTADKKTYQTIYAQRPGSVAAPTAGLHFTPRLIEALEKKGVKIVYLTLHVGLGTFAPVKTENLKEHKMHSEWYEIGAKTMKEIIKAKKEKRRVIAVGTTSVRTLESVFKNYKINDYPPAGGLKIKNFSGWTDIFIYPPYKFKAVDAMITNFHLPKSTLLMLISAFAKAPADKSALAGRSKIFKIYEEAIRKKYRFFSYGDAMLII